jgi:ribosome-binding factor A
MSKADQVNQMLHQELALAINREVGLPNALITVAYVRTSADLKWATVGISVLPDKLAGTALSELKKSASVLSSVLLKKTKLRQIPRFRFEFDPTERKAAVLDEVIGKLDEEEVEEDFFSAE